MVKFKISIIISALALFGVFTTPAIAAQIVNVSVTPNIIHYGEAFNASTNLARPKDTDFFHTLCNPNKTTIYNNLNSDGSIWGEYWSVSPTGPLPQAFIAGESVDGNWASGGANCTISVETIRWINNHYNVIIQTSSKFTVLP